MDDRLKTYRNQSAIGFAILMFGVLFGLVYTNYEAHERDDRIQRAARTAVKFGCAEDARTNRAIIRSLDGQIAFIRRHPEAGPPSVGDRVNAIREIQRQIPIPNCHARVEALTKELDD